MASVHGPVRPVKQHGSSVVYRVAPVRGPGRCGGGVDGDDLGVPAARRFGRAREAGAVGRDEHRAHPRIGRRAWHGRRRRLPLPPPSSPRPARPRSSSQRTRAAKHTRPSLPSGLTARIAADRTPSAPGFHRVGPTPPGEGFAGCDRRFGLSPTTASREGVRTGSLEPVLVRSQCGGRGPWGHGDPSRGVGAAAGQQVEGVRDDVEDGGQGLDRAGRRPGRVDDQSLVAGAGDGPRQTARAG